MRFGKNQQMNLDSHADLDFLATALEKLVLKCQNPGETISCIQVVLYSVYLFPVFISLLLPQSFGNW